MTTKLRTYTSASTFSVFLMEGVLWVILPPVGNYKWWLTVLHDEQFSYCTYTQTTDGICLWHKPPIKRKGLVKSRACPEKMPHEVCSAWQDLKWPCMSEPQIHLKKLGNGTCCSGREPRTLAAPGRTKIISSSETLEVCISADNTLYMQTPLNRKALTDGSEYVSPTGDIGLLA